jgi:hypothetical protein
MRRYRTLILWASIIGMILSLSPTSSSAQEPFPRVRIEAVITGNTAGSGDPIPVPTGRTRGDSSFTQTEILFVADCRMDPRVPEGLLTHEIVVGSVKQLPGNNVGFTSDDDATDGFGEVHPTGGMNQSHFDTANGSFDAVEFRLGNPGDATEGRAVVEIVGGRFHRILATVLVELTLNVRIDRIEDGVPVEQCHHDNVPFRIVGQLLPADPTDVPPLDDGFILVGVGRTGGEGSEYDRAVCEAVPPALRPTLDALDPNGTGLCGQHTS